MVLARRGTAISNKNNKFIPDIVAHRIIVARVAAIAKGGFHLRSVYLKDSFGMNPENNLVRENVAATVRCLQGPCVIAGDWNMEPASLSRSGFLAMVNGTIVAPELLLVTVRSSIISW